MIIIPARKKLILPMRANITTEMMGLFKFEAVDMNTGKRRVLADWFPNLILNSGLDAVGTSSSYLAECRVGTGNTAPANSQTSLVAQVGTTITTTTSSNGNSGSAPYYGFMSKTFRFAAGVATGNLAEVGIGPSGGGNLFSRALIVDGGGAATTITVLASEALDVTYQLRLYAPASDVVSSVSISSISYATTIRAAIANGTSWAMSSTGSRGGAGGQFGVSGCNSYDGTIGAVTSTPSGSAVPCGSVTNASYTTSNYYRDFTVVWGLSNGSVSINALAFFLGEGNNFGYMQVGLGTPIPKTSSNVLTLNARHTWTRKILP